MTDSAFSRTALIFGEDALEKLSRFRVAVFGIGGVGSYVVEALARSGIGHLDLTDNDVVCASNINRQLVATTKTIGQYKVDVAAQHISDINPRCDVIRHRTFYSQQTSNQFDFSEYDYIVDAIDTISGKIELAVQATQAQTPIISAMGAGNKVDPTAFEVADIYKTSVCPLAHIMRKELRKRGIKTLKVVYSKEPPLKPLISETTERTKVIGSTAFVPSVAGLIIAGEVIKDLLSFNSPEI